MLGDTKIQRQPPAKMSGGPSAASKDPPPLGCRSAAFLQKLPLRFQAESTERLGLLSS